VSRVRYEKGKFLNAMNPASAERNEQNVVTVRGRGADVGFEVTFKQIAGLLARRIVCRCKEGETVERGQRVGLIKFGSRVDVVLPAEAVLRVKVGERVKGGASVLAAMRPIREVQPSPEGAESASWEPPLPAGAPAIPRGARP
jgi:phosphatidylserine decarboxylase